MEGVQMEQLANGATMPESIVIGQECAVEEGIPAGVVNGQLEIEIPAGDARQGAIHTIQLQSPGGNTHIVEGLVVSNTGHGDADGVVHSDGTLFHSGAGGTFLLPTSHGNSLANSTLIASPSGEMITADGSDHHILSGLQVVRVTTGENCETIFLVPANGGGKDGMQQVMVLQPAEDLDEQSQVTGEVVEEAVELNIPSPKPVLTNVKQEMDGQERTILVSDHANRHFESPTNASTTLVVVSGDRGNNDTTVVARQEVAKPVIVDKKPVLSTVQAVNGHASTTKPTPPKPLIGIAAANDDRPKRKAAIKATATRKAALASLTSPRKSYSSPKSPKKNANKAASQPPPPPVVVKPQQNPTQFTKPVIVNEPPPKKTSSIQVLPSAPVALGKLHTQPPPPPFIQNVSGPVVQSTPPRVILAGGTPIQATPRSYFLMPEDIVSDSDDEGEGPPLRKCVVCLRRRRFTENIFDVNRPNDSSASTSNPNPKTQLVQNLDMLLAHLKIPLNIQAIKKKPHELGVCTSCLDSLQRWHVFNSAIAKRHETVTGSGVSFDDSPVNWELFETRVYRNFRKMAKVKEVYRSATHRHYIRRTMTEKDWDFFCDHLFRSNSLKSERARELERYVMSREKLTQIYCVKCQRLVKNGKKGFIKHIRTQHPQDNVLIPCDICGTLFPDKDAPPNTEDFYPHWISHFYFNSCEECGKRFPTKRALGQHKQTAHKNSRNSAQWNKSTSNANMGSPGEDRPWKCDQCDSTFKMKGALVSHRDVVHFNRKNHVCNTCGEAFKSASSLRGHVRRHEGRRDYKCEVCHKEYYTYSALKGHKVVHQTARDFICGICGKAFKKKKALEEHGTLHTGVKPHRCPICGREIRVKSNLYKHMKIHKKNAELGITGGRGRHSGSNSTATTPKPGTSTGTNTSTPTIIHPPIPSTSTAKPAPLNRPSTSKAKTKNEPKVKMVKVEQRQIIIKEESVDIPTSYSQPSTSSAIKMNATNSSPIQGATAMDVVLDNADVGHGQEHRGPIVVSIVTDGSGGVPANLLHMNQDTQQQILNVVTSLANSHGQSVTVAGPSGATFIASPMPVSTAAGSASRSTIVATAGSSGGGERTEEQVITVPTTTQYYTAQQFFNSLDHLQNQ